MKQVLQNYKTGEVKVEEVPPPSLRNGAVLTAVRRSLISAGTERMKVETGKMSMIGKARSRPDLVKKVLKTIQTEGVANTYRKVMARLDSPTPLGYSLAGEAIEVGSDVPEFAKGDRVACAGAEHAHHAEIVCVPHNLVVPIPDNVDDDDAAYTTVGAIALQGVRQADVQLGDNVVVIGLGLLGLVVVQLLKASGARVFGIDVNPGRIELAKQLGADMAALRSEDIPAMVEAFTRGAGADVVMLTAGGGQNNDPIELAGEIARDRGKVVVVGLLKMDVPQRVYYEKELQVLLSRSYGPGRYDPVYEEMGIDYPIGYVRWTERENMREFLRLLSLGLVNVKPLTTHRFTIENATEAYELLAGEQAGSVIGALLEYSGAPARIARVANPKAKDIAPQAKVKLGVIGAGNFATGTLLPILQGIDSVELAGVCTTRGQTAKAAMDKFGFKFATSDASELIDSSDVNALLIATRHNSHADYAVRAMRAGKPAFLEKPLALTAEQVADVHQAWQETGGRVLVGYNRRFSPFVRRMRDFFVNRSTPMSMIYRVNAGPLERNHWMRATDEGGSRVISEGCHFIDVMISLCGADPARVSGRQMSSHEPDTAQLLIEFADGSIGTLYYLTTGDTAVAKEYLEAHCEGRSAILSDFRKLELVSGGKKESLTSAQDKGHKNELKHWAEAIVKGEPFEISMQSAILNTLATIYGMESAVTGEFYTLGIESAALKQAG